MSLRGRISKIKKKLHESREDLRKIERHEINRFEPHAQASFAATHDHIIDALESLDIIKGAVTDGGRESKQNIG